MYQHPCSPMDSWALHMASICALKLLLMLCHSNKTLSRPATEEFTSVRRAGQMFRLLNFSSGRFRFPDEICRTESRSHVPVVGCPAVNLPLSGLSCGGNGELRFFARCMSTCSCLLAASALLPGVRAQSRPSFGWKRSRSVRRATRPATCEM